MMTAAQDYFSISVFCRHIQPMMMMMTPPAEAACVLLDAAAVPAWGRTSASLLAPSEKRCLTETWAELVGSPLACFLFVERPLLLRHLLLILCSQLEGCGNHPAGPNKAPRVGGIYMFQLQRSLLFCTELVVYLSLGSHAAFLLEDRRMFELLQFLAVFFHLIWMMHQSVETSHLLCSVLLNSRMY